MFLGFVLLSSFICDFMSDVPVWQEGGLAVAAGTLQRLHLPALSTLLVSAWYVQERVSGARAAVQSLKLTTSNQEIQC